VTTPDDQPSVEWVWHISGKQAPQPPDTQPVWICGIERTETGSVRIRYLNAPAADGTEVAVKVYLATSGEYSDYRVRHAFTREEDAEAYKLGDDVLELEVHDGPVEVRYWYDLDWRADWGDRKAISGVQVANPHMDSELRDFDRDERNVQHTWSGRHLNVQGWDKQAVLKVYSEQRAKYLAAQADVT